MTIFEVVEFNKEQLFKLINMGVRLEDGQWVNMYRDYVSMHSEGEKMTYIVATLSDRYGISERKVYGIIKRFRCTAKSVQRD